MYNKVDGRLMQAGDRFEFGRCPQGPNGEVEPITWRVLHRYSDSLLVIAEYGLCNKRYNDKFYNESKCITWSNCTLRRWLNNDFMKKVFNAQEQSLIKISNLTNNAGPSTQDQVFLLSEDEARILFTDDDDRVMNLTKYAHKKCGLCGVDGNGNEALVMWWLRSSAEKGYGGSRFHDRQAMVVHHSGHIVKGGYSTNMILIVRPAFRLYI